MSSSADGLETDGGSPNCSTAHGQATASCYESKRNTAYGEKTNRYSTRGEDADGKPADGDTAFRTSPDGDYSRCVISNREDGAGF